MFGLSRRFAGRVASIQRKVTSQSRRQAAAAGRTSFFDLSRRLNDARREVARGRKGR